MYTNPVGMIGEIAMLELKDPSLYEVLFVQVPYLQGRIEADHIHDGIEQQNQEIGRVSFHNPIIFNVKQLGCVIGGHVKYRSLQVLRYQIVRIGRDMKHFKRVHRT